MSVTLLARLLSILGHPALLMPAAVAWAAHDRGAPVAVLLAAVGVSSGLAAIVGVYSLAQVRAGRWAHVDASAPHERRTLVRFVSVLAFGAAAALWLAGQPAVLVAGLLAAGALLVCARLTRRWLKLSLHAAFAMFAATLLWPDLLPFGLALAVAAAVAWSRCRLGRHTVPEVLAGLLAGAAAGAALGLAIR